MELLCRGVKRFGRANQELQTFINIHARSYNSTSPKAANYWKYMVDREGFEPSYLARTDRFTVCWLEPLTHLSDTRTLTPDPSTAQLVKEDNTGIGGGIRTYKSIEKCTTDVRSDFRSQDGRFVGTRSNPEALELDFSQPVLRYPLLQLLALGLSIRIPSCIRDGLLSLLSSVAAFPPV